MIEIVKSIKPTNEISVDELTELKIYDKIFVGVYNRKVAILKKCLSASFVEGFGLVSLHGTHMNLSAFTPGSLENFVSRFKRELFGLGSRYYIFDNANELAQAILTNNWI